MNRNGDFDTEQECECDKPGPQKNMRIIKGYLAGRIKRGDWLIFLKYENGLKEAWEDYRGMDNPDADFPAPNSIDD